MNYLENIRELLTDYLKDVSRHTAEEQKMLLILGKKDFYFRVRDAFFNLVADTNRSPESIVNLLDIYTSGLEGFSTNKSLQAVVSFACFEGLTRRKPKVLFGSWETLVWLIVKFTSLTNTPLGSAVMASRVHDGIIPNWITKYTSQELCPNPCLRLELFKFIRAFQCNYFIDDRTLMRDNIISTILELSDNNTSLTAEKVPNFTPVDLQGVINDSDIGMGIITEYELDLEKTKIIVALLNLTKNFALLVEEKYQRLNNDELRIHISFELQLAACFSFCGLLPNILQCSLEHKNCMLNLVKAVYKDSFLLNYVIETLDTINQVSLSFPIEKGFFAYMKETVLYGFFKGHINRFPEFQYLQEIHGGISPASEYRIRYLQNNSMDQYKSSVNKSDSESYASNENDDRLIASEDNDHNSAMDFSDVDTSDREDLFNEEDFLPYENQ